MKVLFQLVLCVGVSLSGWAKAAAPERIIFVVMGGYNSCPSSSRVLAPYGIGMYAPYKALETKLKTAYPGMEVSSLISCLPEVAPPNGEAKYVLSSNPNKLRYGDSKDIYKEIRALMTQFPDAPTFIAGHSYGGWMAMYMSEAIKSDQFKALFTMDPIGPACGPLEVVFGSSDCHRAPRDRDNRAIADNVAHWSNFFQKADSWLTSSEIDEADANYHVKYNWGPHSDVDGDKRVWAKVEQAVTAAIATASTP